MNSEPGRANWGTVALATLTQNVATGFAFGSFGSIVLAIEREFAASRAISSLAIALVALTLSLTAPLIGRLIEHVPIRRVMMGGALLGGGGYAMLSVVRGPMEMLAIYALMIGPATAALGVLPSMTLASRAVSASLRGRAMGIVNMPVFVMIVPLVLAGVLEARGLRFVYVLLAIGQLLMLPLLLAAREPPQPIRSAAAGDMPSSARLIVTRPAFWLLTLALGLIVGAGTMKLAHFVPLLTEQGRTYREANLLLALAGGAGLVGSVAFGWLADRIGGARALVINALLQAVLWMVFLAPVGLPLLVVDALVVGACGGGVQGSAGVLIVSLFGLPAFSRAFGLLSLATLPLLFGLTPIASLLYEHSHSYHLPMALMVGGFVVAAGLLAMMVPGELRTRATTLRRDQA